MVIEGIEMGVCLRTIIWGSTLRRRYWTVRIDIADKYLHCRVLRQIGVLLEIIFVRYRVPDHRFDFVVVDLDLYSDDRVRVGNVRKYQGQLLSGEDVDEALNPLPCPGYEAFLLNLDRGLFQK